VGGGAALGGGWGLLNFAISTLSLFTVPSSPSAPTRATLAGALLGVGAGLMQADATDSCRQRDGTVPESAAASASRIVPGVRARVRSPTTGPARVTRWVVGRNADTLLLAQDRQGTRDTVSVALDDIAQLDLARVRGLRATRSVLTGGLLGAVVGGVVGYNQASRTRTCFILCDATPAEEAYLGAFDGAVAGAAVGLLVDRRWSESRWVRVPLHGRGDSRGQLGVRIAPARGGVTLALTLRPSS
jgi:hypothetical protein